MSNYIKRTEVQLLDRSSTDDIEKAVDDMLRDGYELVSVSYVGGCKTLGHHVYHFLYRDES